MVELDEQDERDPKRHVDEPGERADRVERLRHGNAPADCARDVAASFLPNELRPLGIRPRGVETCAEENDIRPIDEKGAAVGEEIGEQPGRERQNGDDAEKNENAAK